LADRSSHSWLVPVDIARSSTLPASIDIAAFDWLGVCEWLGFDPCSR
jgi:hypothetical protein